MNKGKNPCRGDVRLARFEPKVGQEIGKVFSIIESAVCKTAKRVEQDMSGSRKMRKEVEALYSRIKT